MPDRKFPLSPVARNRADGDKTVAVNLVVCILGRNVEAVVAPAVESARAAAAAGVVYGDLGSADASVAVAAGAGADTLPIAWTEDFAAARQTLVDHAFDRHPQASWVLWLNAAERLDPRALPQLAGRTDPSSADPAVAACFLPIVNRYPNGGEMVTADIRLFRRRPGLRWVGRLHPHLHPDYVAEIAADGLRVDRADDVRLLNTDPLHNEMPGLPADASARLRFTARLLELELRDRPGQLHYQIQLGRVLLAMGDPTRGHETMRAAAETVAAHAHAPRAPGAAVQDLLAYLLAAAAARPAHSHLPSATAAALAERWFPHSPPLLYALAEWHFRAGRPAAAAALLERLLALGASQAYDPSSVFDPGMVGDDARINLAACYRALNRPADAAALYRQLLGSPHYDQQAREALGMPRR